MPTLFDKIKNLSNLNNEDLNINSNNYFLFHHIVNHKENYFHNNDDKFKNFVCSFF